MNVPSTDIHFPHEYLGKEGIASIKRASQIEVTGWRPLRQAPGHKHAPLYADSVPCPVQDTDKED
jgi:hypothetical protein